MANAVLKNPDGVQRISGFGLIIPSLQVNGNMAVIGSMTKENLYAIVPYNIFPTSEFNTSLANKSQGGNVTDSALAGFAAAVHFNPTVDTWIYETLVLQPNTTYTFSAFVKMDDGSVPRIAQSSGNVNADLTLNIAGLLVLIANSQVTLLSGTTYRVSGHLTTPANGFANWSGLLSYATLSGKNYIASGFQLEVAGAVSAYQITPLPNPVFDGSLGTCFEMSLSGNVTGATLVNVTGGVLYTFILIQDGVGGRTFAWPAAVKNASVINPAANSISVQTFKARNNGNLYPIGPMTYN